MITCGDCVEVMREMDDRSVDAIITSPPYDGIREYKDGCAYDLHGLGRQVERVLKPGAFAVVVIADQKKDKRLSGTTALMIIDWMGCDLSLCDWLIYHRPGRIGRFHSFRRDHESILVFFAGAEPKAINTEELKRPVLNPQVGKSRPISTRDNDRVNIKQAQVKSDMMDRGSVWSYKPWLSSNYAYNEVSEDDHPAMMAPPLARDLVLAFTSPGDLILDPFAGSGTTGQAALEAGRRFTGIDISEEYCALAERRIAKARMPLL